MVRRREKGAQAWKVGSARKVAKKEGHAVDEKLVPRVELAGGRQVSLAAIRRVGG